MLQLHTLIASIFFLLFTKSVLSLEFKKEIKKSCSALTDKGTVDLSSVSKTDPQDPPFSTQVAIPGAGNVMTGWNPCVDTTISSWKCTVPGEVFLNAAEAEGCVTQSTAADATFSIQSGDLMLSYVSVEQISTHIVLKCSKDVPSSPLASVANCFDSSGLCYTFTHKVCCPGSSSNHGGLSPGSVLLIILLVLVVCYIIGGILFMKFVKKSTGAELCPNLEFWKSLPFVVKDGVMFTIKCGKTDR